MSTHAAEDEQGSWMPQPEWRRAAALHRERALRHTGPSRERRARALRHPIEDFLFEYYSFPPSLLEKWQPGLGARCEHPPSPPEPPHTHLAGRFHSHDGRAWFADPARIDPPRLGRLRWIRDLLRATASRPANFACHGLHEWAMVYRCERTRHEGVARLRLPQGEIDALVESRPIRCSHFDAYRFFTPAAAPLNRLRPTLDGRPSFEQAGCVHANMDLYKWAAKAMPWTGSDLLLDCFELALELRALDMRASPYDVEPWGLKAVKIESVEGRAEYEGLQRELAGRAQPLRERLLATLDALLAQAPSSSSAR